VRNPNSPGLLLALARLAHVLHRLGRYEEAVTPRVEALNFIAGHPSETEREFTLRILLGVAYMEAGDYDNALHHLLWAAGAERKGHAAENGSATAARSSLGVLYMRRGEFAEAEQLYGELIAIHSEKDVKLFIERANFAWLRFLQGKYDESEALALEAVAAAPDEKSQNAPLHTLALLRTRSNSFAQADELFSRVEAERRRCFPADHPKVAALDCDRATLRIAQGQSTAADDLLRGALAMLQAKLPADHPLIAAALLRMGQLRVKQGRPEEAKSRLESALAIYERKVPKHPETLECRQALEALAAGG